MSRERLAELAGISAVSVFRIESGQQQPRPTLLEDISRIFGKTPAQFYSEGPNFDEGVRGSRSIPVLDIVQGGEFPVIAPSHDKEIDSIFTDIYRSAASFALRVRGRSMEPDFREGDLVIVDPSVPPQAEDFVAARDERGEGTFKQFRSVGLNEKGEQVYELASLNPAHPTWRSDRMQISILGTMVEHRRFRRR
jgi:SOS-response transcriptional repressor LexA